MRPILEYNSSIWNPYLNCDIDQIENVQRKFTKILCQKNNISFSNYTNRLQLLNLDSLQARRIKFDLILMYKIFHNLIDINFDKFFSHSQSSTMYNLRTGHNKQLHIPKYSGSIIRQNFFSNRILDFWNKLPKDIINSQSLTIFKSKLNSFDVSMIAQTKF